MSEDVRALVATVDGDEGSSALARLLEHARRRPLDFVPLLPAMERLLDSANTQVREASLQSLAFISEAAPSAVAFLLPRLHLLLSKDSTETVSEQAIAILSNYGRSNKAAAERVLPILREAVGSVRKSTVQPLVTSLTRLTEILPERREEITESVSRLQKRWSEAVRSATTKVVDSVRREN